MSLTDGDYLIPVSELAQSNAGGTETLRSVANTCDTVFTWDYERARPALSRLYEKAKRDQWDGAIDLDWSTSVDPDEEATHTYDSRIGFNEDFDLSGTACETWGRSEWIEFNRQSLAWMLSQFLHGEQGALVCTAKIVETVPWIDAKYYAATQVIDEARHVEVFSRYLDTKIETSYPVNPHLSSLLDDIVGDSRWDLTYLGMQIMVEGLALAAFAFMTQTTQEPLLRQLLKKVMADEARHVAFGVLSLQEVYRGLSGTEIRERQEFAFEAAVRMRDRFLQQEVWERMGVPAATVVPKLVHAPQRLAFNDLLFTKIVPNCRKLGLLDAGDGWLRDRFRELGVIRFEHLDDGFNGDGDDGGSDEIVG